MVKSYRAFEPGKYWLDAGLSFAYETTVQEKTADSIEGKILLEKSLGNFNHIANIVFGKEVGGGRAQQATGGFAWSSRYRGKIILSLALNYIVTLENFVNDCPIRNKIINWVQFFMVV